MSSIYDVTPPGCTRSECPSCKRLFFKDDNHKECNYCVAGMVWVKSGECHDFGHYVYHPEKDPNAKQFQETVKNG